LAVPANRGASPWGKFTFLKILGARSGTFFLDHFGGKKEEWKIIHP